MSAWTPSIDNCDAYLGSRTGKYAQRAVRYRAAARAMKEHGLTDDMTVVDVGAGWTEFDYCLRAEFGWLGRYIPVDGGIDGTDLNDWTPSRRAEWFVGLEIIEHLNRWKNFLFVLTTYCTKGVVLSTPNPLTTDVFGMDETHVTALYPNCFESRGFTVTEEMFYGGRFSNGEPDSLLAVYLKGES